MLNSALGLYQLQGSHRRATGAERMADLRRRNPSYDRQCKARYRARRAAYLASLEAEKAEKAAALAPLLARHTAAPTTLMLPAPAVRLALPAPVIDPTVAAIDALAARLRSGGAEVVAARADLVALPVR